MAAVKKLRLEVPTLVWSLLQTNSDLSADRVTRVAKALNETLKKTPEADIETGLAALTVLRDAMVQALIARYAEEQGGLG